MTSYRETIDAFVRAVRAHTGSHEPPYEANVQRYDESLEAWCYHNLGKQEEKNRLIVAMAREIGLFEERVVTMPSKSEGSSVRVEDRPGQINDLEKDRDQLKDQRDAAWRDIDVLTSEVSVLKKKLEAATVDRDLRAELLTKHGPELERIRAELLQARAVARSLCPGWLWPDVEQMDDLREGEE